MELSPATGRDAAITRSGVVVKRRRKTKVKMKNAKMKCLKMRRWKNKKMRKLMKMMRRTRVKTRITNVSCSTMENGNGRRKNSLIDFEPGQERTRPG